MTVLPESESVLAIVIGNAPEIHVLLAAVAHIKLMYNARVILCGFCGRGVILRVNTRHIHLGWTKYGAVKRTHVQKVPSEVTRRSQRPRECLLLPHSVVRFPAWELFFFFFFSSGHLAGQSIERSLPVADMVPFSGQIM